jgi:hypothetical protein
MDEPEEDDIDEIEGGKKKKDKKLVFLSRSVLEKIKERPMTTGTQIANEILELYKRFSAVSRYRLITLFRKWTSKMSSAEYMML